MHVTELGRKRRTVWAVAGARIWVLRAGTRQSVPVSGPCRTLRPAAASGGASVLALRMAPDGVRAALLVHDTGGNSLMLAAVASSPDSVTSPGGPAVSASAPSLPIRSR